MCAALAEHWQQYYQRTADLPPPERVKPFLDAIPQGGTVLDFGCGTGRFARYRLSSLVGQLVSSRIAPEPSRTQT